MLRNASKPRLSFEAPVYPSNLLAIVPSRDGRYPELPIQSVNKIINNLTLEILTENLETPDFANKEIIYILKVWQTKFKKMENYPRTYISYITKRWRW